MWVAGHTGITEHKTEQKNGLTKGIGIISKPTLDFTLEALSELFELKDGKSSKSYQIII
jgi:hypothetical protein